MLVPVSVYAKRLDSARRALLHTQATILAHTLGLTRPVEIYTGSAAVEHYGNNLPKGHEGAYNGHNPSIHVVYLKASGGRLVHSLAHELRHAYQMERDGMAGYDWSVPHELRPLEADAEAFANQWVESLYSEE